MQTEAWIKLRGDIRQSAAAAFCLFNVNFKQKGSLINCNTVGIIHLTCDMHANVSIASC